MHGTSYFIFFLPFVLSDGLYRVVALEGCGWGSLTAIVRWDLFAGVAMGGDIWMIWGDR